MKYQQIISFVVKLVCLVFLLNAGFIEEIKAQTSCIPSFYNLSDTGVPSCYSTGSITRFERKQRWKINYPGDNLGSEIGTGDIGQYWGIFKMFSRR